MPTDTSAGPMPRFQAQNAIATNATMQVTGSPAAVLGTPLVATTTAALSSTEAR